MFLGNLKNSEAADLFLKMACYVAMSEGDFSEFEESIDWQNMGNWELDDFYSKFIDAGFSENEKKKVNLLRYDIKSGLVGYDGVSDIDYFISEIKSEVRVASEKFIESIKDNKELNKKIMISMMEAGADISSVNDATTKAALLVIPEIKKTVLESMMLSLTMKKNMAGFLMMSPFTGQKAESERNPIIDSLTLTQKKTMIFELVGMGNVDEEMGDLERVMVEAACDVLGVEKDFIEDAEGVIKMIMSATDEALELINE